MTLAAKAAPYTQNGFLFAAGIKVLAPRLLSHSYGAWPNGRTYTFPSIAVRLLWMGHVRGGGADAKEKADSSASLRNDKEGWAAE